MGSGRKLGSQDSDVTATFTLLLVSLSYRRFEEEFFWTVDTAYSMCFTSLGGADELCLTFMFLARLFACVSVLALLVVIFFAIMRLLEPSEDDHREVEHVHEPVTERAPLRPPKPEQSTTYGACEVEEDEDIECGSCLSSSSEELYDGKICVICYDEERNCFFVPCGHCATCYDCAQRILDGEGRVCPVCRRPIRRVRRWFNP